MRVFQTSYRDRKRRTRTASRCYVEFKDHRGATWRAAAFTDKRASEGFGRQLETFLALRAHLDDFEQALRDSAATPGVHSKNRQPGASCPRRNRGDVLVRAERSTGQPIPGSPAS